MNKEKMIAKAIVLAQISSDAGKGFNELSCSGDKAARMLGYSIKNKYILDAIRLINSSPRVGFNYSVQRGDDQNFWPSVIVYFDFKIDNVRQQVSFHSPLRRAGALLNIVGKGRKTRWDGQRGGSSAACQSLIDYYGL